MSAKSVQVQLPTGEVIWARVAAEGPTNVASSKVLERLDADELRNTIRGVSGSLRQAVEEMTPDEVQVEFGLELALKTGKLTSILAEASGAATIKVALTWRNENPASPDAAAKTTTPAT